MNTMQVLQELSGDKGPVLRVLEQLERGGAEDQSQAAESRQRGPSRGHPDHQWTGKPGDTKIIHFLISAFTQYICQIY